ncbi:hypothetical protein [Rhizobium sp. FKY42]|uniref:hypothetical protein n=1 Tax=Rhizobium sp. FKY42 TaxID=2562310 RepID=UPI0010C0C08F|nr:hypothetical protein [Rhizobium sp. FKY42]
MPAGHYGGLTYAQRNKVPRLSDAHEIGQFVRLDCAICKISRHYLPEDIQKLCGDVNAFQLRGQFRCERCGQKDSVSASFVTLLAREKVGLVIRRLERIEIKHVPIWRDVTL